MKKSIDAGETLKKATALYNEKKFPEAVELWKSLEDADCAEALYMLGICYNYNLGVEIGDEEERARIASGYFIKSAEKGHAEAQCFAGLCFRSGTGVDKDLKKSVEWFEKSAAQNCTQAMNNLGQMYERGEIDVEIDGSDDCGGYEDGEDGGYEDGEDGEDSETKRKKYAKSMSLSFEWYKKSAQQEHDLSIKKCKELGIDLY